MAADDVDNASWSIMVRQRHDVVRRQDAHRRMHTVKVESTASNAATAQVTVQMCDAARGWTATTSRTRRWRRADPHAHDQRSLRWNLGSPAPGVVTADHFARGGRKRCVSDGSTRTTKATTERESTSTATVLTLDRQGA